MYKAETVFKVNTVGKMLWGLKSSLDAVRLAARQTLYRLMRNRLGTLWLQTPGSEGLADHSTGCLMLQDMLQVRGIHRAIWRLNKDPKGRRIV